VAGSPELRARFERVRVEVLCQHVRRDNLREEVRNMRERMRKELSAAMRCGSTSSRTTGGIADIEFSLQYWALLWARQYPPVAMFSDTIRQLESVASAKPGAAGERGPAHPRPIGRTAPAPIACPSRGPRPSCGGGVPRHALPP